MGGWRYRLRGLLRRCLFLGRLQVHFEVNKTRSHRRQSRPGLLERPLSGLTRRAFALEILAEILQQHLVLVCGRIRPRAVPAQRGVHHRHLAVTDIPVAVCGASPARAASGSRRPRPASSHMVQSFAKLRFRARSGPFGKRGGYFSVSEKMTFGQIKLAINTPGAVFRRRESG
jgi:hypothetical protein